MDHNVKGPLDKRLGASGYPATVAVENLGRLSYPGGGLFRLARLTAAQGQMLKSGVTKLGIAATYAPNTKDKVFWTLILAST